MNRITLLIAILLIGAGCTDDPDNSSGPQVKMYLDVEVETDRWWSGPPPNHEYSYDTFFVAEGEDFGPEKSPGVFLFHAYDVISQDSMHVSFDSSLVVVGEPISSPSQYEYIGISDVEDCLRTRTYDSGYDYCIRILK